ncbi:MAG: sulfatase-like hydrolase/transferase [Oscillospiraceae bacterium]|nr:sulfatase-like hydrolase/transferase [Oscillospiraceae bacterium]
MGKRKSDNKQKSKLMDTIANKYVGKMADFGSVWKHILGFFVLFGSFFSIELLANLLLKPEGLTGLLFGAAWSLMISGLILFLPRLAARIAYGVVYFVMLLWTVAQAGYDTVFNKMMWFSTIGFAGEGADYLGDVLSQFPLLWWLSLPVMIGFGVLILWFFPRNPKKILFRLPYLLTGLVFLVSLFFIPELVFSRDKDIWGTRSEYGQSSSYRATYNTMYDAKKVYNITGIYQLTLRDIWVNELYPLTPQYRKQVQQQSQEIDAYFAKRGEHQDNEMTGLFQGKNVVLVLMESMDDWMITTEDTPTIEKMMSEGIQFTNFYTPGYGSARTLNSEFCMNTGIYLPTTGRYLFDYVTNGFNQSIASQMNQNGYSSLVFHYNDPAFYSRGVFEPAMGYEAYIAYQDYTTDKNALYSDELLFDLPQIRSQFFREGPTFNTIITRSAHLSYQYNEVLNAYALQKYPQYKGLYGSQEEDCARVKAKLVDDMFARLLQELEAEGQLENTVIIAMTDHYTYGYKNSQELYAHSNVDDMLLLEKTPCFIWSADCPDLKVDKTLNTADLLPTVLNLMGIDSPYPYLGQDAFDPNYEGYALFPDGSWICNGVAYKKGRVIENETGREISEEKVATMEERMQEFQKISNLLLTCNYYKKKITRQNMPGDSFTSHSCRFP